MKIWRCGHSKVKVVKDVFATTIQVIEYIDNSNHQEVKSEELFDVKSTCDTFYQCFDCGLDLTKEVQNYISGVLL